MTLHQRNQPAPRAGGKDSALQDWVRALEATAAIAGNPRRILFNVIEEVAAACGEAPALISARETLTYRSLIERANRYARWTLAQNLAKGDAVALMMPNRPEYLAIWLGITSVGGVVSLINTNLRGASLAHCLDIAAPKHVIVAAELNDEFRSAAELLASRPKIWSHGSDDFARIDRDIEAFHGRTIGGGGTPRRDDRGSRAAYLHLRHDRPAESRECQSSPADAMELLVCRIDEYRAR